MKSKRLFRCFFLYFIGFVITLNSHAQATKIAIVSAADTTFIHRHVGITAFTNFIDTLPINFSMINHFELKLQTYLKDGYSVTVVHLPDSVLKAKNGFFSSKRTKKIKQWIKASKDLYDFVIVIENMGLSENDRLVPENTSGIFSRLSIASYYTTISFDAYRTSDLKALEYYNQGEFMVPIKNFKLPEDRKLTPEMIGLLSDGFKSYLDGRVERFLAKTYIVAQDKIDAIKTQLAITK